MQEENEKISLPKELQEQILKFFMKTSIPRKMQLLIEQLAKESFYEIIFVLLMVHRNINEWFRTIYGSKNVG